MSSDSAVNDLLVDPCIRVTCDAGETETRTLAGVLAGLSAGTVRGFPGLRPHQHHAWHAFLVQLAAMALESADSAEPPADEAEWRNHLQALTDGASEPWQLVVDDLKRPAFMQAPVPSGNLKDFKKTEVRPDLIDVPVTTKSFDQKMCMIHADDAEAWIFALVSMQTMDGYGGSSIYGIARMNGGLGNRPCVAYAPSTDPSVRFGRDVAVLLAAARETADDYEYRLGEDAHRLIWLEPWDGKKQLMLPECHPWFIEICRRVRMEWTDEGFRMHRTGTSSSRIEAKDALGNTGDPWTPVKVPEAKALTASASGFPYGKLQAILFSGDYRRPPALQMTAAEKEGAVCIAQALVRGQGVTEGLHERVIPVPPKAAAGLMNSAGRDEIGELSKRRVEAAREMDTRVLRPSLRLLAQGGEYDGVGTDYWPWVNAFDRAVDRVFFNDLWRDVDADRDDADTRWNGRLKELAQAQLEAAIREMPLASGRRLRAVAAAERCFHGAYRNHFESQDQTQKKEVVQ